MTIIHPELEIRNQLFAVKYFKMKTKDAIFIMCYMYLLSIHNNVLQTQTRNTMITQLYNNTLTSLCTLS